MSSEGIERFSHIGVAASLRVGNYSAIYNEIAAGGTGRKLGVAPFMLADIIASQYLFGHENHFETDLVFAEMMVGMRVEGAKIPFERKKWNRLGFDSQVEYPEMYNFMRGRQK